MKNMFSDDSARVGTYDIFYGYCTVRWVRSLGPGTLVRSLSIRGVRNGRYGTVGTESWYVGIGLLVRWVYGTVGMVRWVRSLGSWYWSLGTVGTLLSVWYGGYGVLVRWYWSLGTVGTVRSVWYGGHGGMVRSVVWCGSMLGGYDGYSTVGTVGTMGTVRWVRRVHSLAKCVCVGV